MIVTFDYDQQIALLAWLTNLREAECTLDDIIEGLERGYLTTTVTVTDSRYSGQADKSIENEDFPRVSEEV